MRTVWVRASLIPLVRRWFMSAPVQHIHVDSSFGERRVLNITVKLPCNPLPQKRTRPILFCGVPRSMCLKKRFTPRLDSLHGGGFPSIGRVRVILASERFHHIFNRKRHHLRWHHATVVNNGDAVVIWWCPVAKGDCAMIPNCVAPRGFSLRPRLFEYVFRTSPLA